MSPIPTNTKSDGEAAFAYLLRTAGRDIPEPECQYAFARPARNWTFDFAWPMMPQPNRCIGRPTKAAIEIDGGNRLARIDPRTGQPVAVGRHTQDEDYEKLNAAAILGWRILRFTPQMLEKQPDHCLNAVRRLLGLKPQEEHATNWSTRTP